MSVQPPQFHEGFDADWISSVLLKNNWGDYYNNDWGAVASNITKLVHNDPPYPLPSVDAGVYEVRLWAWKVLTMEKYALVEHPTDLLNMTYHFTVTGKMLREMSSSTSVWLRISVGLKVTDEIKELASHAIWEWIEKGKTNERKRWMNPFTWVFGQKEVKEQRRKGIKGGESVPYTDEVENMDEDEEDGSEELPPPYKKS